MEALHLCEAVDLVQVVESVSWRGVRIVPERGSKKGTPAAFPPSPRGTVLRLGPREALLGCTEMCKACTSVDPYFRLRARSTPGLSALVRHAGHGPWDDTVLSRVFGAV